MGLRVAVSFTVAANEEQLRNKRGMGMCKSIETDDFRDDFRTEVLDEKRPVLMACLSHDFRYSEQKEVLDSVSSKYGEALKVCLRDKETLGTFRRFEIEGSPTFIIFHEGEERGRMLGKAERDTLSSFISRILSSF